MLAMYLRGDAFTAEEKARNFAYYEPLTVRDSSLSACVQAAVAAEVGHLNLAYDYLAEAALMDLDDLENNTRDGLHIASLAGSWIALVGGFGGMRQEPNGMLCFAPRLPERLSRLVFTIMVRGRRLRVDISAASARYSLDAGEPLRITHHGEPLTVSESKPAERALPRVPPQPEPRQPRGRGPADRSGDGLAEPAGDESGERSRG